MVPDPVNKIKSELDLGKTDCHDAKLTAAKGEISSCWSLISDNELMREEV